MLGEQWRERRYENVCEREREGERERERVKDRGEAREMRVNFESSKQVGI